MRVLCCDKPIVAMVELSIAQSSLELVVSSKVGAELVRVEFRADAGRG